MQSLSSVQLLSLRQNRQLHPQLQARLKLLLEKASLDGFALAEGWGLAGSHRSDLVAYLRERRILHFEIFGSASTVHRDVNILLMSNADVRVALLMDREADPRVAEEYFRVIADNRFHWFWLSQFLDPIYERAAVQVLMELLREAQQVGGPLRTAEPSVSVSPSGGQPFSRIVVRVAGFHPDRDFSVFWDPEGITTLLGIGRGIRGAGTGECELYVPHGGIATAGQHTIRAVDSLGNVATTTFSVSPAWPPPSMRAVPNVIVPGKPFSIVGGGAPPNIELTVFLWSGHQGWGFAKLTTDQLGEFAQELETPWLLGHLELVKPDRYKLSASPTEGGPSFEAHTYVDVPPFSPPGTLEWEVGSSHKSYDIAVLRPHFRVVGRSISISFGLRNDRAESVFLLPHADIAISEMTLNLIQNEHKFDAVEATSAVIESGEAIDVRLKFERKFEALPADQIPPARLLHIVLPVVTSAQELIQLRWVETFPFEIWAE